MSIRKAALEKKLQESKVLSTELASVQSTAKVYQRKVPSSNIFLLENDTNTVKSATLRKKLATIAGRDQLKN
ncbi:unnamed protein product [Absidia cylindrospora]